MASHAGAAFIQMLLSKLFYVFEELQFNIFNYCLALLLTFGKWKVERRETGECDKALHQVCGSLLSSLFSFVKIIYLHQL